MKATTAHKLVDFKREFIELRRSKNDKRRKKFLIKCEKSYIKKQIRKRIKELQYHAYITLHIIDDEVIEYFEKRGYKITKQEHQYTIAW